MKAESIVTALRSKGYVVFEKDGIPYNLNIVGIRNIDADFDKFTCRLAVLWKHNSIWHVKDWPITTYPGERYMVHKLLNPMGAAILCEGQYKGVYGIRKHRGQYNAMCQEYGPVRVYRDGDRDREFDMKPSTIISGWFGINIHRSKLDGCSLRVGAYSAGCQVFQCGEHFAEFMYFCTEARKRFGNKFTYTLINNKDLT